MSNDPYVTVIGNLTADPELRFTNNGAAVANWTVAQTPRHFDRNANEWKDGETLFFRCAVWREYAENLSNSLRKGMRVMVYGRLKSVSWADKTTGEKRTGWEIDAEEVGPALRYATATVNRTDRGGAPQGMPGSSQGMPGTVSRTSGATPGQAPQGDPWATNNGAPPAWTGQAPQGAPAPNYAAPQGYPQGGAPHEGPF